MAKQGLFSTKKKGKKSNATGYRPVHPRSPKRPIWRRWFAILSIISFATAFGLSVAMLAGCQFNSAGGEHLYVAKVLAHTPDQRGLQLGVGYFGGCFTLNNTNSDTEQQTHCITNMRLVGDIDDLGEEFSEDLHLDEGTRTYIQEALITTLLPTMRHLQENVFHWEPPVFHLVSFVISASVLGSLATNITGKRAYKTLLAIGVLFGAVALPLAFVTSIGAIEASNAMVGGNLGKVSQSLGTVSIYRANMLYYVQAAQVSCVGAFYFFVAFLFAGAQPKPRHPV